MSVSACIYPYVFVCLHSTLCEHDQHCPAPVARHKRAHACACDLIMLCSCCMHVRKPERPLGYRCAMRWRACARLCWRHHTHTGSNREGRNLNGVKSVQIGGDFRFENHSINAKHTKVKYMRSQINIHILNQNIVELEVDLPTIAYN